MAIPQVIKFIKDLIAIWYAHKEKVRLENLKLAQERLEHAITDEDREAALRDIAKYSF